MIEQSLVPEMLNNAFQSLPNLERLNIFTGKLQINDGPLEDLHVLIEADKYNQAIYYADLEEEKNTGRTEEALRTAATCINASSSIHKLLMQSVSWRSFHDGPPGSKYTQELTTMISKLITLRLCFDVSGYMWLSGRSYRIPSRLQESLGHAMTIATRLEHLELRFSTSVTLDFTRQRHEGSVRLESVLGSAVFQNLKSLHLDQVTSSLGHLQGFFLKHAGTLKQLTLHNFCILEGVQDTYEAIFKSLRDEFILEEATMGGTWHVCETVSRLIHIIDFSSSSDDTLGALITRRYDKVLSDVMPNVRVFDWNVRYARWRSHP